jgi:hypothetical protein
MAAESTFRFVCPACGKKLHAPLSRAGTRGKCSACGKRVPIPKAQFTHVELVELQPVQQPLLDANGPAAAVAPPPAALRVIEFHDRSSVKAIAEAMAGHETFALTTRDARFQPLGRDVYSAHVWIESAGGGMLMTFGAGLLVAAFTSDTPLSKMGLYVSGGSILALTGGLILQTILLTRPHYAAVHDVDAVTGNHRWILKPATEAK